MDAARATHAVAHTARILKAIEANPKHPREAEYARSLRVYRGQWAELSDDEKRAIADALINDSTAADMDQATVTAAIAALEG